MLDYENNFYEKFIFIYEDLYLFTQYILYIIYKTTLNVRIVRIYRT